MFEAIRGLVGDLARPWAIIVTSTSAAVTPIIIVVRTTPDRLDLIAAAALIGAAYTGVAALYGAKAVEVLQGKRAEAKVEIAKAQAAPADDGELPASQRVRP